MDSPELDVSPRDPLSPIAGLVLALVLGLAATAVVTPIIVRKLQRLDVEDDTSDLAGDG